MTNYDQPLSQTEQAPLTHEHVNQALHVASTLDHIQSPVQFGDYIAAELDVVRHTSEARGYSPAQGEAAIIGVALGTSVNSPQKGQIFRDTYPYLMDRLSQAGIEDQDKSFIGNAVTHIANSGANTAVIMDIVAGIDPYAKHRESEGADTSLVRTTLFAIGFGASTIDRATKGSMANQLQKQVKQR